MNLLAPTSVPALQLGPSPETLAAHAHAGDNRSAIAVASSFESMFMAQIIKEMRQTLEPGTLFGSDSGDIRGGLFDMYLGQHLAQAGGMGIAAMVKQQLEKSH